MARANAIKTKGNGMKWLFSMSLLAVLCVSVAPAANALIEPLPVQQLSRKNTHKSRLPEGSAGVIAVMGAAALGGGLLVWRKKRASHA